MGVWDHIKVVFLYNDGGHPASPFGGRKCGEESYQSIPKGREVVPEYKRPQAILTAGESKALLDPLESRVYVKINDIEADVKETSPPGKLIKKGHKWI